MQRIFPSLETKTASCLCVQIVDNSNNLNSIIRIACILPNFAVVSFLVCCYNGNAASYTLLGLDLFEALPMASFFLLLTEYVVPDGDLEGFFAHFEVQDKAGNVQPGGSAIWYQVRVPHSAIEELKIRHANYSQKLAFGVTQWLVVSILLWIATAASLAAGTYCATSNNIHFAHIWVGNSCIDCPHLSANIFHRLQSFESSQLPWPSCPFSSSTNALPVSSSPRALSSNSSASKALSFSTSPKQYATPFHNYHAKLITPASSYSTSSRPPTPYTQRPISS
jgi:hypothetical protein